MVTCAAFPRTCPATTSPVPHERRDPAGGGVAPRRPWVVHRGRARAHRPAGSGLASAAGHAEQVRSLPMSDTEHPRQPRGPFRRSFWRSPIRGPWLTSVLGLVLLGGVPVLFVTGLLSYAAYDPGLSPVNDTTPGKGW